MKTVLKAAGGLVLLALLTLPTETKAQPHMLIHHPLYRSSNYRPMVNPYDVNADPYSSSPFERYNPMQASGSGANDPLIDHLSGPRDKGNHFRPYDPFTPDHFGTPGNNPGNPDHPGGGNSVPLDNGLVVLLAAGLFLGVKMLHDARKKQGVVAVEKI
jgi:hypothetical protein